ncbi:MULTISPECIES: hypothetical protein [Sphingomonas]|jgi:hypothetical protein|uniref:Lipoprotein n=1 Tax=Sphingomonas yabuuchiae TaxID=172044 RepID=A0AA41DE76_9SPHN|nr:hypothetical protein [Sphingomonas yabuuchiae]MBB4610167.1 hypothetical protein [Sphingomonas yabuuchiae]MBN3557757.1 hypothetical protein [Sphingomonas yabuuchiae]
MAFDLRLTTAMAAALLASGCNRAKADDNWTTDRDTAICTDAQGVRLPDDRCRQHRVGGGGGAFWYFLGRGRAIPWFGERATGGSFRAATGARYAYAPPGSAMTRSAAVSRGGFGSSARRFGSIHA